MRKHPDSPPARRLRGAALVLVGVLAVLLIAPAAGAASTRTAAASTAPAVAVGAERAASFEALGAPSGRIVLAKADPCAALFGSVKQACENFGKSSGSGSKSGSSGSSSTSVLDIPGLVEQAVDAWFGDLVKSALTPILTLLGKLVLSTPDMTGGRIGQIYTITLGIADAVFVLLVVVGGVIVMSHETIQSRYALKQILPRLVLGFIAANLSIHFVSRALQFGNALTQAIWSTPLSGAGIGNQLLGYILTSIFLPDGVTQIFTVLFGLVLAGLALAVLFSFALRTAGLLLLVILAPPMLMCHALPGLDAIALLWWRLLAALLAIGFLQAATLMLMLQVFFDPDSNVLGVPTSAGLIDLVVCGALFVILLKIPGWVLRMVPRPRPALVRDGPDPHRRDRRDRHRDWRSRGRVRPGARRAFRRSGRRHRARIHPAAGRRRWGQAPGVGEPDPARAAFRHRPRQAHRQRAGGAVPHPERRTPDRRAGAPTCRDPLRPRPRRLADSGTEGYEAPALPAAGALRQRRPHPPVRADSAPRFPAAAGGALPDSRGCPAHPGPSP